MPGHTRRQLNLRVICQVLNCQQTLACLLVKAAKEERRQKLALT
jgi:hypothetical protein